MNETANATLALGALPVMAHAGEEVEEMARLASALVLNIGTLSEHWVEAMLLAGGAANERGIPVVLDPVGAGATGVQNRHGAPDPRPRRRNGLARQRRRGRDARRRARPRCAESSRSAPASRRRSSHVQAARRLGVIASVTGPVDHVSDGERVLAVSNGHELLATVTGTGCMS